MSEPAQEKWLSQTIYTYKPYKHFECHDILCYTPMGGLPFLRQGEHLSPT